MRPVSPAVARSDYEALLQRVRKVLAEGRARAKASLEREEVRTWWEVARVVNEHLRVHDGRAGYGEKIVSSLAGDLGVTKVYLYEILRFQKAFPIVNHGLQLTLSHYRSLSKIENPKERTSLFQRTVRRNLSILELRREIHSRRLVVSSRLELAGPPALAFQGGGLARKFPPLIPRRGKFFTYQIVKRPPYLHPQPQVHALDVGLRIRHEIKLRGLRNPKEGEVVEALRTHESPAGDRYRFQRVKKSLGPPKRLLYTCVAYVRDVHDDDTLWVDIDLGFRFWPDVKLRLWGIDAAEIEEGKPASDFVKRTLARVPFVVITLRGREKFGRPLVDLFYLEGTEDREKVLREGIYLNQELLDLGLAKRV